MGYQIGLTPDQVLDMSLSMFNACVEGYTNRLLDQRILGVYQGFWAGYYNRVKRPTPPATVAQRITKQAASKKSSQSTKARPDVDVAAFKATEEQFWKQMREQQESSTK